MTTTTRALVLSVGLACVLAARTSAEPPAAKTDLYGDPLPEGAVARLGTVRLRVPYASAAVSFSADGRTFLTFQHGGILRTWDARTGQLQESIRLTAGSPFAGLNAGFSDDGKFLALHDG